MNWPLILLIVVVVIGIWWGNVEMVRILFRRQAERMKRQREAYQFVLDNYDTFVDERKGIVTERSLFAQKFKQSEENRAKVEIVIDTLNRYGHVIEEIKLGETTRYVFGASRDDIERAIANSK
jgi:hypothetical protein